MKLNIVRRIPYIDCTNPNKIPCADNKLTFSSYPSSLLGGVFCSDFLIKKINVLWLHLLVNFVDLTDNFFSKVCIDILP